MIDNLKLQYRSRDRNHSSDDYRSGDRSEVAQRTFSSDVSVLCFMGVTDIGFSLIRAHRKLKICPFRYM